MLEGENDLVAPSRKVGVTVAECVEIGASPQSLTRLRPLLFTRVMDEDHREIERSLKLAEVAEESRNNETAIFVETMEPDQGVEEKKLGPEARKRSSEPRLVPGRVETKDRGGDDRKVERVDIKAAIFAEALDAGPHLSEGIFCKIYERGTSDLDFEVPQGRGTRSNAHREV
jgi:hypothetical protein